MHVLQLTEDQKHTLRTMSEKIAALRAQYDEAQAAQKTLLERLEELEKFRRETASGMCQEKFGDKPSYIVEESEDGEYLTYGYGARGYLVQQYDRALAQATLSGLGLLP